MILNGKRRYIRSRKPDENRELHLMNVYVDKEAWKKSDKMAGPEPLGVFVEELIVREYRRREKRMVQEMEFSINSEPSMS